MPTKRFDNLAPERRSSLLDAAREEFIAHGFNDASLNTIVQSAGISKGSLYYYFEDKEDLFIAVMEREINGMIKYMGGLLAGEFSDDFWGDVDDLYRKSLDYIFRHPELVGLTREFHYLSMSGKASEALMEFYDIMKTISTKIMKHGQELGAVRTDLPIELLVEITYQVDMTLDMWMIARWEKMTEEEINRYYDLYFDIFRKIVGVESQEGGKAS